MNHKVAERLIHTLRYSGNYLICQESVSDHIWSMISLSLEYVSILNERAKDLEGEIDIKELIYRICIHDLDESLYCDIPRPFKYHSEEILNAINKTADTMMLKEFGVELSTAISESKSIHSKEGILVKIFDSYQAANKMISEVRGGNMNFIDDIGDCIDTLGGIVNKISSSSLPEGWIKLFSDFIIELKVKLVESLNECKWYKYLISGNK